MTENKLPNMIDRHVGRRVRWRRRELKLSQEKLAAILGLTFQQIQKYEKGTNRISSGRLFDIARALDTTVNFFYRGAEEFDSHAQSVISEPDTGDQLGGLIDTDSVDLVVAFQSIPDEKLRKSILRMVTDIAGWARIDQLPDT